MAARILDSILEELESIALQWPLVRCYMLATCGLAISADCVNDWSSTLTDLVLTLKLQNLPNPMENPEFPQFCPC